MLSAAAELDLAVVAAFIEAQQQRMCSSSSSASNLQLQDCPSLMLYELLSALPAELLRRAVPQQPSLAAALLSYLQAHPGAFAIKPSAAPDYALPIDRYTASAFAAAGAFATWQVHLRQREVLQLLLRHNRWAGLLPSVEAELLLMMKPRSCELPLVPRVALQVAIRQLERVLPELRPYLQVSKLWVATAFLLVLPVFLYCRLQ
jgi:hypothetical protein